MNATPTQTGLARYQQIFTSKTRAPRANAVTSALLQMREEKTQ